MANREQFASLVQDVICSHWGREKNSLFTTGEARASCSGRKPISVRD
jgi:hypothetical protein